MQVALRIEISSLSGALDSLPGILNVLDEHQVSATFFVSLGPDHSKSPFHNLLPAGLLGRLPATRIGRRALQNLRQIPGDGHEVGIGSYTPCLWRQDVAFRSEQWTRREVAAAVDEFESVFGRSPDCHSACNWQINASLLQMEDEFNFRFASDTRGKTAFYPQFQEVRGSTVQIPTTLPTLDELLRMDGVDLDNVHGYLFAECQRILPHGEIFSFIPGENGAELLPVLERMIVMWKGAQWDLQTLGQLHDKLDDAELKRHQIGWGEVTGREGFVAMQSIEA